MNNKNSGLTRHVVFAAALLIAAGMAYGSLRNLFMSRLMADYHMLIPFIPIISFYLIYLNRRDIRQKTKYSLTLGSSIALIGLVILGIGIGFGDILNESNYATVIIFSAIVFLWGVFIFTYGPKAYSTVLFPLFFLVFMIPIPPFIMDKIITFLQIGSTEFADLLFWLSRVPYYREGFLFHLPRMSVEVAPQCSGIRSGLALFITACLAGYLFLSSKWRRILLILFVIPITMFKNGIRIVTLTLLGTYVDPRILQSSLHREGGIPFFILALLLMSPVLFYLRKRETTKGVRVKLK